MTYLPDLHTYLHQSSLLIQAYPTTRITTKYSLPRRPHGNPASKRSQKAATTGTSTPKPATDGTATGKEKREPAATLTLKTFHADSGICLKYQTDKAQEVGRLLMGLGRLAKGEVIEMPATTTTGPTATASDDKMDVDTNVPTPAVGSEGVLKEGKTDIAGGKSAAEMTSNTTGGGKKKKKGGKK